MTLAKGFTNVYMSMKVRTELQKLKYEKRETYNHVVLRLLDFYKKRKRGEDEN